MSCAHAAFSLLLYSFQALVVSTAQSQSMVTWISLEMEQSSFSPIGSKLRVSGQYQPCQSIPWDWNSRSIRLLVALRVLIMQTLLAGCKISILVWRGEIECACGYLDKHIIGEKGETIRQQIVEGSKK